MLLDILDKKYTYAMQILKTIPGVITADALEGHPNILVIVEAADRQRLVELMIPVLDSIDYITKDVRLLVNRDNSPAFCFVDARTVEPCQQQSVN